MSHSASLDDDDVSLCGMKACSITWTAAATAVTPPAPPLELFSPQLHWASPTAALISVWLRYIHHDVWPWAFLLLHLIMNWCANNKVFISGSRSLTAEALVQLILHCVVIKCSRRFRFVPGSPRLISWLLICGGRGTSSAVPEWWSSIFSFIVRQKAGGLTGWWRDWHQKKMSKTDVEKVQKWTCWIIFRTPDWNWRFKNPCIRLLSWSRGGAVYAEPPSSQPPPPPPPVGHQGVPKPTERPDPCSLSSAPGSPPSWTWNTSARRPWSPVWQTSDLWLMWQP